MGKIDIWIIGNAGDWDNYNPLKVIQKKVAKEILYILNNKPSTISELAKFIKDKTIHETINSLLKINAIRKERGKYWVNFPIFSMKDQKIILNVGKEYGKRLAYKLLEDKSKFIELVNKIQCSNYIEKDKIIFATIGCFSLNWDCLNELEKNNFLILHKKQPGNREYILQGGEPFPLKNNKLYCISRSMSAEKYTFTSFGGPGKRFSLPDLLWEELFAISDYPQWNQEFKEVFIAILSFYQKNLLIECGKIIESIIMNRKIKMAKKNIINFLKKLEYICEEDKHYKIKIPVFLPEDKEVIDEINKIVREKVCNFVEKNYVDIKKKLSKITPVINKVPFSEIFVDVWHKIFGYCNMFLSSEGFMYEPEESYYHSRYLSWIIIHNKNNCKYKLTSL